MSLAARSALDSWTPHLVQAVPAKSGHRPQEKAMERGKLLLGRTDNGFTRRMEAGEKAAFHSGVVASLSSTGSDPAIPFVVVSGSHWNHCLPTCTANWEMNISKRTVDTFWKANFVTHFGSGIRATLNIWLILLCLNGSWWVWEICSSSRYWAAAKLFSFICFISICPDAAAHPWEVQFISPWGAVCLQKACGWIPCTASEFSLQFSGLLVTVDQTGGSHEQDVKARGQYPVGRGHTVLSVVAREACESSVPTNSCLVLLAALHSPPLNQITQVWMQLLAKSLFIWDFLLGYVVRMRTYFQKTWKLFSHVVMCYCDWERLWKLSKPDSSVGSRVGFGQILQFYYKFGFLKV